jgi:gas vesicle protein
MSDNNGSNNTLFFLAGLAIGAVAALLYAPQSGEKTRKLIGKKADEGRQFLRETSQDLREQAEDFVQKGREVVSDQMERGRDLVSQQMERGKELVAKQKEQLSAALDAVKDGYKEAKRAAH